MLIAILLVLAAVFRFWNFFEIPNTYDEFSALFRTYFDSFSELIEFGVRPDGHPALIQVFTYYYVGVFGDVEWVGKIPYVLCGLGAIWLVYKIGTAWFNETVGVLSAAFMVAMQYMVLYSQIARPYISGLFFSMLMVHYWTKLIQHPEQNFKRNATVYVLASALCAYNHHFSLLFAAIVGLTGFFVVEARFRLKFVGLGLFIFLLYVPHLSIFFGQLSLGGVEQWLAKPENDFLLHYLHYIVHFSTVGALLLGSIIFLGLKYSAPFQKNMRFKVIAFLWFILPLAIGFFYSRYDTAVLQYSVLIFSFPFLLFFFFGWIRPMTVKWNTIVAGVIVAVMGTTLVVNRQHYAVFYESKYVKILEDCENLDPATTAIFIDTHHRISEYYISHKGFNQEYIWMDSLANPSAFEAAIIESKTKGKKLVYLGSVSATNPVLVNILSKYYPTLIWQNNYLGGITALYSESISEFPNVHSRRYNMTDALNDTNWSGITRANSSASPIDSVYLVPNTEWGPRFSIAIDSLRNNENDFIDMRISGRANGVLDDLLLVSTLEGENGIVHWQLTDFGSCVQNKAGFFTVYQTLKLSDVRNAEGSTFKTFIWNKSKRSCVIWDYSIFQRCGNKLIYGLTEPIES